jgi:general secretion pathway protein M
MDDQERIVKSTALAELWASFWDGRTEREKQLLTWGGLAVALVIGWSVLWSPASDGRARLREALPAQQRQLAQMTAEADEARSLSGAAASVAPSGATLKNAIVSSLPEHGLSGAQVQMVGVSAQVQLKNVSFADWASWLNDVRRQLKVEVVEAHVTALKADGQVDVTASLQPATAQQQH